MLQAVTGPLSFTLSKADIESVERIQAEITRLQGVAALDQSAILAKQLEIDALLSAAGAITTTSFELALIKNLRYHQLTYGPSHRATRALESSFAAYKGSKAAVNERLEATPRRLQQALFFVHLELARIWKSIKKDDDVAYDHDLVRLWPWLVKGLTGQWLNADILSVFPEGPSSGAAGGGAAGGGGAPAGGGGAPAGGAPDAASREAALLAAVAAAQAAATRAAAAAAQAAGGGGSAGGGGPAGGGGAGSGGTAGTRVYHPAVASGTNASGTPTADMARRTPYMLAYIEALPDGVSIADLKRYHALERPGLPGDGSGK